MTDNQRFSQLLDEFRRIGVDPDSFSAVLAITPDEAMRVMRDLPDDAGPAAFLHRLREDRERVAAAHHDHPSDVRRPA